MDFIRRCRAEIDLDALDFNLKSITDRCPDKAPIMVVKANAYGHSDAICVREYYRLGQRRFAVSNLREAERVRKITGDSGCLVLVFGYIEEGCFEDILRLGLTVTIGSVEFAERLNKFALGRNAKIKAHVALDTGMSRVGVRTAEEIRTVMGLSGLETEAFYFHFPAADMVEEEHREFTLKQYEKFRLLTDEYGLPTHCLNSGGISFYPELEGELMRPGLILYGLSANPEAGSPLPLKQVMTLKSVVDQIKLFPKGTDIGYGRTYTTDSEQLIAVVPTGYADGYSRMLSNRGKVLVNGVLCPIRGRVCMDQMMIDVTGANAKLGDEVLLYSDKSKETSIEYIAKLLGTITNEVVCNVSSRVPRVGVRNGVITEVEER
ncbi:MAG: alanine racemase [Bacteroides sp.]|nr:alanine racemase [Bacteroides sp.]